MPKLQNKCMRTAFKRNKVGCTSKSYWTSQIFFRYKKLMIARDVLVFIHKVEKG